MSLGLAFWVIMLVAIVFTGWSADWQPKAWGGSLVWFVLLFILGWSEFGPPIHG